MVFLVIALIVLTALVSASIYFFFVAFVRKKNETAADIDAKENEFLNV